MTFYIIYISIENCVGNSYINVENYVDNVDNFREIYIIVGKCVENVEKYL